MSPELMRPFDMQRARPKASAASVSGQPVLRPRVLVVDDERALRTLYVRLLSPHYETVDCESALDALDALLTSHVDMILTDLDMPGMSGLTLIERARQMRPDLPIVMMTGSPAGDARRARAAAMGVPVLSKPFGSSELLRQLQGAWEQGATPVRP